MDETTIFFARLAAAYFVVTGLGFLISTDFYAKMVRRSASTDPVTLNLSGAAHFVVGLCVVLLHFRFSNVPQAIVTLIGLAALAKGAALIAVPKLTMQLPKIGKVRLRLAGLGFLAVGAYLGWSSFA